MSPLTPDRFLAGLAVLSPVAAPFWAVGPQGSRTHDLRHTAASVWLGARAEPKVVQRILGHATTSMRMDLYGHLMDANLWEAARSVGASWGHLSRPGGRTKPTTNRRRAKVPGSGRF